MAMPLPFDRRPAIAVEVASAGSKGKHDKRDACGRPAAALPPALQLQRQHA